MTLIADERRDEHAEVQVVEERLAAKAGCRSIGRAHIDPGIAIDLFFEGDERAARASLSGEGAIDRIVQPAVGREKRVLVADMDSTMIRCECIDELADYAGVKAQVAAVTEAAMRGDLDFEAALDARVALLAGLPETVLSECLAERVHDSPGARTLVRTMRARGASTVLVSGGFTAFADPVGARLGFETVIANRLEIVDGRLTGRVRRPIVTAQTKLATLERAVLDAGVPMSASLTVGDGANDLPMIRAAGLGVAYHAKPIVAEAATARIEHGDLTALLYAQGIPRRDWIEG